MPSVWLVLAIAGVIGAIMAVVVAALNVLAFTGPALFFTILAYGATVVLLSVMTASGDLAPAPLWALRLGLPLLGLAITWGAILALGALI